jgi:hypothetical protein
MLRAQHGAAGLAPSLRHQAPGAQIMQISIYTQKRIGQHSNVKVCTPVVQGKILQTVCRRSRVWVLFTLFWTDKWRTVPVCKCMSLVCTLWYCHISVYASTYQYVPVCTGLYLYSYFMASMYLSILVHTAIYQYRHIHIWHNWVKCIRWEKIVYALLCSHHEPCTLVTRGRHAIVHPSSYTTINQVHKSSKHKGSGFPMGSADTALRCSWQAWKQCVWGQHLALVVCSPEDKGWAWGSSQACSGDSPA